MSRFIFLSIGVLIGISYFTSKMYSLGFRFDTVTTRILFFVFLVIPVLFMGSILLPRSSSISINPTLYREIQLLTGVGFYLFLGAIVVCICLCVALIARAQLPLIVPLIVLTLSIACAVVGYIQSKYIHIVTYTVTLADAPESWNGRTAVLVSDTHFGLVNYKNFSNKVVDAIIALHPDFVLHAGDFYDGPSINTAPITESWKRLTETTPVYMAPGNHEAYGDYAGFLTSLRSANITVLDDKVHMFDGVQIAGITYRAGADSTEAQDALNVLAIDVSKPAILINHPPTSLRAAATSGVDLMVSGHTHNGQFWPMTYLVRRIYGPYYHGLVPYEDMSVLTTSGVGTFGPPFRLFNTPELVVITFKTI